MADRNELESTAPVVSVIMGTYNEEHYIESCLDALLNQRNVDVKQMEILIADGGSHDNTRAILDRYQQADPRIRWFDNPSRISPAAWNICLDHARGDVILLMGAHTVVNDEFVSANLKVLDQVPDAGCVGGRVNTAGKAYLQNAIALALNSPFGVGSARYRYADKPQYLETINYGACRKVVFEKVGRFREDLIRNEDWEFNYRLGLAGFRLFFSPDIHSTYYPRTSFGKLWKQQYWTSFGKVKVIRQHPASFLWRHVIPGLFVAGLAGGILLGQISRPALYSWLIVIGGYAGLSLTFSARLCLKSGWGYLPMLPIVFLWIHLSYGIGLIGGLLDYLWSKEEA